MVLFRVVSMKLSLCNIFGAVASQAFCPFVWRHSVLFSFAHSFRISSISLNLAKFIMNFFAHCFAISRGAAFGHCNGLPLWNCLLYANACRFFYRFRRGSTDLYGASFRPVCRYDSWYKARIPIYAIFLWNERLLLIMYTRIINWNVELLLLLSYRNYHENMKKFKGSLWILLWSMFYQN